jgi:hypothetical protein
MHAFIDESRGDDDCILIGAAVEDADLKATRVAMRDLLMPGRQSVHCRRESNWHRTPIANGISAMPVIVYLHLEADNRDKVARAACREALLPCLPAAGVTRVVSETREGQDHADRVTLARLVGGPTERRLSYVHAVRPTEPGLWIADAVGWCFGRGGEFRRRVQAICAPSVGGPK